MQTPKDKQESWFWTPSEPPGKEDPPVKSLFSQILEHLLLLIVAIVAIKMLFSYLMSNKVLVWISIITVVVIIVLYRLYRHNRNKNDRY